MYRPLTLNKKEIKLMLIALGYYYHLNRENELNTTEEEELLVIQSKLMDYYEE